MEPAPPDQPRNPYSPPAATVADAVTAARPMPGAVRRALYVYVASFVLGLVMLMIRPAADPRHAELSAVATAISVGVVIVLGTWLFWKISAGRNWARIVLLVLTIISVPASFIELVQLAPTSPVVAGLKLIEQGMDIAVLYLLFFPGREFFKRAPR
jgi:membrane-bound metal-dependent hydrolase YbcI (DUF457 family)